MTSRFPLASLLRLRRIQQDAASAELARTRAAESDRRRRAQRLRATLGEGATDATSAEVVQSIAAARASAASMLGELDTLLAEDAAAVAEAEAAHAAAKTRTTQLEKLADRHADAVRSDDLRAEQQRLDEHAGRRPRGEEPR